jgi:hypothetical protein
MLDVDMDEAEVVVLEGTLALDSHPFQGDAVSPILSDDGSINKVWIGMAGCLGSV